MESLFPLPAVKICTYRYLGFPHHALFARKRIASSTPVASWGGPDFPTLSDREQIQTSMTLSHMSSPELSFQRLGLHVSCLTNN